MFADFCSIGVFQSLHTILKKLSSFNVMSSFARGAAEDNSEIDSSLV